MGKKTSVWGNKKTNRVVYGVAIQDALGAGWSCSVGDDWKHVSTFPSERRVVIAGDAILPKNDVNRAIARDAKATGLLKILAYGREYSCYARYLDSVRVVVSWGELYVVSSHAVREVLWAVNITIDLLHFRSAAGKLGEGWSLRCILDLVRQIKP